MQTKNLNVLVATAVAALIAGAPLTSCKSSSTSSGGAAMEKHACAGKNSCKGQGGCKTDKNACAGKNACKGMGGCKSGDNGCSGKNSCKGKGGCAVPAKAPEKKS